MSFVNKVTVMGNLGKDPELKSTKSGIPVVTLSVATNENYTDKSGQKVEKTEWHNVQAWGKTAENCAKYLKKGSKIYVEGKLQTRSWDDKDGNKRYTTEIVANTVQFISTSSGGGTGGSKAPHPADAPGVANGAPFSDEEIPF